jgi:hypothetical protein
MSIPQLSCAAWACRGLRHRLLPSGGVSSGAVAALGSSAVLLVVGLVTTVLSFGVMAFISLVGLESQGRSREPHPLVGEAVRPSYRTVFWTLGYHTCRHRPTVLSCLRRGVEMVPAPRWLSLRSW